MSFNTPRKTFRLPMIEQTFSVFPNHGLNSHFAASLPKARTWIGKYESLICGPKMRAFMDNCQFELFAAYIFPYADPAGLKATMDHVNILWLYDEFTDTESPDGTTKSAIIIERTLKEPDFDDGTWICHMMQDFRRDHIDKCGPNVARRFIENFCKYVYMLGSEVELREKNEVLDIQGYNQLRREASAVRTSFDLVEYCLGIDLPDYVHENPIFISGYNAGMDIICWINDLFSYDMEQAKGHGNANAVTVVMKSRGINLQSAVDFLAGYCESLTTQLLYARNALKSLTDPAFSRDAVRFFDALGDWILGNAEWCFVTERYFGKENDKVRRTRIVELTVPSESSLSALKENFTV